MENATRKVGQSRSVVVHHLRFWSWGPWFESGRDYHSMRIPFGLINQNYAKNASLSDNGQVGLKDDFEFYSSIFSGLRERSLVMFFW